VVGDHGMVYRYRVVPIDYAGKNIIDAPMMPAASTTQVQGTRLSTGARSDPHFNVIN
jgi:hypothetical protein